jgi:dihydrofolate reductase / thymidylate synthase
MSYENEEGYLEILKDILKNGQEINNRNGITISNFGYLLKFNNINNFPLLTTKRVYFKGVLEELLWFLKGSYNTDYLQQKNIHIWDGNSSREYLDANGFKYYKEGELGPVYGWQWRSYGKKYNKLGDETGVDQIKYVLEELLKSNNSRRAILNAWNPSQLNEMALPPCHMMYNFYKNNDGLSCLMTMRSSDLFLGLPFNIASTALLTSIIAKVLHLNVSNIALSLCDAHIYKEHINAVNQQLSNNIINNNCFLKIKKEAPCINTSILEKINWINNLESDDFEIINYKSHNTIKAIMK